jgi:hypothetical protein
MAPMQKCTDIRADTYAEFRAESRAELCADGFAETGQRCRNELQKWIAETVENLALVGGAEKMAAMQKHLQIAM